MDCAILENFKKGKYKISKSLTTAQQFEIMDLISYAYNEGCDTKKTVVYTDTEKDRKTWENVR